MLLAIPSCTLFRFNVLLVSMVTGLLNFIGSILECHSLSEGIFRWAARNYFDGLPIEMCFQSIPKMNRHLSHVNELSQLLSRWN